MLNNEIYKAFDTNTESFKEMMDIINAHIFDEDGEELHHIVPITWFAQNDAERPNWAKVSNWADLIRSSDDHPANHPSNKVYLSKADHDKVHELMQKCALPGWKVPAKAKNGSWPKITKVAMKDPETRQTIKVFDSLAEAVSYLKDNKLSRSNSLKDDISWHIHYGGAQWGYIWDYAN